MDIKKRLKRDIANEGFAGMLWLQPPQLHP